MIGFIVIRRAVTKVKYAQKFLKLRRENVQQRTPVTLCGLKSRPELNERKGTVLRKAVDLQTNSARYIVSMQDSTEISLKMTNLVLLKGTCVEITSLVKASHHNGRLGRVVEYTSERVKIRVAREEFLNIKPANLLLA